MKIHRKSLRPVLAALCGAGAALLAPTPGLAHDAKEHAAHLAQMEKAGSADYKRSVKSYAIPDVALTDADARRVRLRDVLATSDPVMLNFIFTTCSTICPVMTRVFSEVPGKIGGSATNLRMVSISIDPENDTPAELKAYSKKFGASARWQFLTGRVEDVKTVQRAFDTYRGDKMTHEPLTLLRAAPDQPWVRIDGFASAAELASEYRKVVAQ